MNFTDNSIKWLIAEGYDMEFGARPLKRIVQDQVETMLAKKIIAGEIKDGDYAEVFYDKSIQGLNIRKRKTAYIKKQDGEEILTGDAMKALNDIQSTNKKKKKKKKQ